MQLYGKTSPDVYNDVVNFIVGSTDKPIVEDGHLISNLLPLELLPYPNIFCNFLSGK